MWRRIALAVTLLAPAYWLLNPHASFYFDWGHNLWMCGYFGAYLRAHGSLPVIFNSASAVGTPMPIFYGYLLYPILGIFSSFLGAALALRLGVLLILGLQAHALMAAGRTVIGHWLLRFAIMLSLVWSVYSLTNLYNRSALPEFFAAGFSVAAAGYFIAALSETDRKQSRLYCWAATLSGILAAGSHPPTALLAGILAGGLGVIFIPTLLFQPRWRAGAATVPVLAGGAAIGALILMPWVYANLLLGKSLAAMGGPDQLFYLAERSDSWLGRLNPIPYDGMAHLPPAQVSTPFLEAPLAAGLLLLALWNLALLVRFRSVHPVPLTTTWQAAAPVTGIVSALWLGYLTLVSIPTGRTWWPNRLTPFVQFGYRLVTHANLALMLAIFASGSMLERRGVYRRFSRATCAIAIAVIALTAGGAALKLDHAGAIREYKSTPEFSFDSPRERLITEGRGWLDPLYATPSLWRELTPAENAAAVRVTLPVVATADHFGRTGPAQIDRSEAGWGITNITAFPWSIVEVNGRISAGTDLARSNHLFAVRLPAGHSVIRWSWRPNPTWLILDHLSRWTLAAAFLFTAGWVIQSRRRASPRH